MSEKSLPGPLNQGRKLIEVRASYSMHGIVMYTVVGANPTL